MKPVRKYSQLPMMECGMGVLVNGPFFKSQTRHQQDEFPFLMLVCAIFRKRILAVHGC